MREFLNAVVLIADSLRYDHVPRTISESGTLVLTLAPALNTPQSIPSIITGRNAINHNVRRFSDSLDRRIPTLLDLFPNSCFYDHPLDPMLSRVLRQRIASKPIELNKMKEPFIWIERMMEMHLPYGRIRHQNEVPYDFLDGRDYVQALRSGKMDARREYRNAAKHLEEHFFTHVDELKGGHVWDRTLVVLTSDHGELLGEHRMFTHNYPPCRALVEVPTVFVNTDFDVQFMRGVDIFATVLAMVRREGIRPCDSQDITKRKPMAGMNYAGMGNKEVLTTWKNQGDQLNLAACRVRYKTDSWVPIPVEAAKLVFRVQELNSGIASAIERKVLAEGRFY